MVERFLFGAAVIVIVLSVVALVAPRVTRALYRSEP